MADKAILTNGKCLTANHIAAGNQLLRKHFPNQNGLWDTHYIFHYKSWDSDPSQIVQILFVPPSHWVCVSNLNCDVGTVNLYDSMFSIPTENGSVVRQICTILRSLCLSNMKINVVNIKQQVGGTDCGLFSLAIATDLCFGIDPFLADYIQEEMRQHLEMCFQMQHIARFPSRNREIASKKTRVWQTVSFELYCICRQPEGDLEMVCCDQCDVWFHTKCVPDDINPDDYWFCSSCKLTC